MTFQQADNDGNGELSVEEYTNMLRKLKIPIAQVGSITVHQYLLIFWLSLTETSPKNNLMIKRAGLRSGYDYDLGTLAWEVDSSLAIVHYPTKSSTVR